MRGCVPLVAASLFCLLCAPSALLAGDACVSTRDGAWSDASFDGPAWDCGGGAPDPNDTFNLAHAVTTAGSLSLGPTGGSVTLEATGSWTWDASTAALQLTLPGAALGFHQIAGSTLEVRAGFRTGSELVPSLRPAPDASTLWRVGDLLLCPGFDASEQRWREDCAGALGESGDTPGDPNSVLLFYDDARFEPAVLASLAAIPADGGKNFVQFYRPAGDDDMSYENAQMYEIVGRGESGGGHWLRLSILQTDSARPRNGNYPLQWRRIRRVAAQAAGVAAGEARVPLQGYGTIDFDWHRGGTWLYASEPGEPFGIRPQPQLIGRTIAGSPETIVVARAGGLPWPLAPSETLYLTHFGIRPGDPFVVLVPVFVTSATLAQGDTRVWLDQAGALTGIVWSQLSQVHLGGVGHALSLQHCAFWDHDGDEPSGHGTAVAVSGELARFDGRYLAVAGAREWAPWELNDAHGFRFGDPGDGLDYTLSDVVIRYPGDDGAYDLSTSANRATVSRIACSYSSANSISAGCWQQGIGALSGVVEGLVCLGCGCDDGALMCQRPACSGRGLMMVGSYGYPCSGGYCDLERATAIGNRTRLGKVQRVRGFVYRDNVAPAGGSAVSLVSVSGYRWYDGLLLDNISSRLGGQAPWWEFGGTLSDNVFENIAVIDPLTTNSVDSDRFWSPNFSVGTAAGVVIRRFLWAFSDQWQSTRTFGLVRNVWRAAEPGVDWSPLVFDGVAIVGHVGGSSATSAAVAVGSATSGDWKHEADIRAGPCLADNVYRDGGQNIDVNAYYAPGDLPAIVRGQQLDLRYASDAEAWAARDFTPLPGGLADRVGCGVRGGARSPGVHEKGWEHWLTGLEPEYLGIPDRLLLFGTGQGGGVALEVEGIELHVSTISGQSAAQVLAALAAAVNGDAGLAALHVSAYLEENALRVAGGAITGVALSDAGLSAGPQSVPVSSGRLPLVLGCLLALAATWLVRPYRTPLFRHQFSVRWRRR